MQGLYARVCCQDWLISTSLEPLRDSFEDSSLDQYWDPRGCKTPARFEPRFLGVGVL